MSKLKILPCRDCGGEGVLHKGVYGYFVMCKGKYWCYNVTKGHETEKEAIREWNIRDDVPEPKLDKWVLCSDELPKKTKRYLVTAIWTDGDYVSKPSVYDSLFKTDDGEWHGIDDEVAEYEVIAWMPLPEPYKGE